MKTFLLLSFFLLSSFSFKQSEPDLFWVGTFTIYLNSEQRFEVFYRGKYPDCVSRKIIMEIYREKCDSTTARCPEDSIPSRRITKFKI